MDTRRLLSWRPSGMGLALGLAAPAVLYLALAVPRLHVNHAPGVVTALPFGVRGFEAVCAVLAAGGLLAAGALLAMRRAQRLPKLRRNAWVLGLLAVSTAGFSYAAAGTPVAGRARTEANDVFAPLVTGALAIGALTHIVLHGGAKRQLTNPSLTSSVERRRHSRTRWSRSGAARTRTSGRR